MSDRMKVSREFLALHRKRKAPEEGRSPTKAPEEIGIWKRTNDMYLPVIKVMFIVGLIWFVLTLLGFDI
jgi:hypothetical protein